LKDVNKAEERNIETEEKKVVSKIEKNEKIINKVEENIKYPKIFYSKTRLYSYF
jgi:hypothetical protein